MDAAVILEGTKAARTKALAALRERGPEERREVLLGALDRKPKKPLRAILIDELHAVADVAVAQRLVDEASFDVDLPRLAPEVREALFRFVQSELKAGPKRTSLARLKSLGLVPFREGTLASPAAVTLVLAVLDEKRFDTITRGAATALRGLLGAEADAHLRTRWQAKPGVDFHAFLRWANLYCPPDPGRVNQLVEALLESRVAIDDETLLNSVDAIPYDLLPRVIAWIRHAWNQEFAEALAARLVAGDVPHAQLLRWLDDPSLSRAHARIAIAVLAHGDAEAVIARAANLPKAVVVQALAHLGSEAAFGIASPDAQEPKLLAALAASPAILRSAHWLKLASSAPATYAALLCTMASDRGGPNRQAAVATLARAAAEAVDRTAKRTLLHALGQTGHPDATMALVAALDDPHLYDGAPLVCTALGACGDTRALPILERFLKGRHGAFVRKAMEEIEDRVTQIHIDVLLATERDPDPLLADLATRARTGDREAAMVLEDALLERGRL